MNWLLDLYRTNPTAQAIAIISLVCMLGMALGSCKVRGIGLGTAGVLFTGIFVGCISKPVDHKTLEFTKELGLVVFVFCIGLQLGPGFLASLRQDGVRLNLLATFVVLCGALLAAGLGWLLSIDFAAILGVFSGATTNTPSLGAAQQTLAELPGISPERLALPALAYAVTYPAAIVGIIGAMLLLKRLSGIDPRHEAQVYASTQARSSEPLERRTLAVDNPTLDGRCLNSIPGNDDQSVVCSRIKRRGETEVQLATGDSVLHTGDLLLAVGTEQNLDRLEHAVGHASGEDLLQAPGEVATRRVAVTNQAVLGKSLRQLQLEPVCQVTVTRVRRGAVEMTAVPNLRLQFGDVLQVVGMEGGIDRAAERLGNSVRALNETHFVPFFAGIVLGIALGTLPLAVPGLPQPLRLGLAGGPLMVAIIVSRLGHIGPFVWHMPANANLAFREFGIALFFASVGLMAGPEFVAVVLSTQGLVWLLAGICVTALPILAVGSIALVALQMNFVVVSGLLAGSMTDPPALAFATNVCESEAPMVAYAAVYPLTTLLRILAAQVLAVVLCS